MSPNPPYHVLLVEDNPIDVEAVTRVLTNTEFDYNLSSAGRLDQACEILAESSVDVVVLDLGLPDGAGIESVQAIRKSTDSPIVVLTTWDDVFTAKIMAAGANDYLSKDEIDNGGLEKVIERAINGDVQDSHESTNNSLPATSDVQVESIQLGEHSSLLELAVQLRIQCSDLALNHPELDDLDEVKAITFIAKLIYEKLR